MIRVPVPAATGTCQVVLFAVPQRVQDNTASQRCGNSLVSTESSFRLIVEPAAAQCSAASLQLVQRALARAEGAQQLPVDYLDVTGGPLAKCKRWIKQKLLGNFKNAYVDVLSRQQSAFNRQTLTALQELAECCTLLNQAVGTGRGTEESTEMETREPGLQDLRDQIAAARRRLADLEGRLMRLEEAVTERASV